MNEATEQNGRSSWLETFPNNGNSRPEVFCKKGVLKIYRRTSVGVSFLTKLQGLALQLY